MGGFAGGLARAMACTSVESSSVTGKVCVRYSPMQKSFAREQVWRCALSLITRTLQQFLLCWI
ncbi:MAG: hypothetical protein KJ690_11735 [Alphaproteobacteria bacterium]|nr:hypothetical protein [Alphaproteobacteria bacterium]